MSGKILRELMKQLGEHRRRCNAAKRRRAAKPTFEILEDRITPTNFLVTDPSGVAGSGSAGDVTLPYAVANAVNGDSITFSTGLGVNSITLNAALALNQSITITGLGASNLAISGNNTVSIFNVSAGVSVTISDLTIENGFAPSGGGVNNAGTLTLANDTLSSNACNFHGGAIFNNGSLTLISDTISGNSTGSATGGNGGSGGGIWNSGVMEVIDSTIANNVASSYGGGVGNFGSATLTNSTLFDNTSMYNYGGAVYTTGTLSLIDDTIAGNTAGAADPNQGYGGGDYGTVAMMDNTIVAGNTAANDGPDIDGTVSVANYCLISNTSATIIDSGGNNLLNVSAGLAPSLAYNGGTTQTLALSANSIAIAAGDPGQAGTMSQNAVTRPASPDIGAYQTSLAPFVTMNSANIPHNATTIVIYGGNFDPNPANDSVYFNDGLAGIVTSATATALTVSITSPPTALGSLTAVVICDGVSSGAPVQVATVVNANWVVTDLGGSGGSPADVTLPYAVASALSGDTITFSFPSASTITLNAPLTLNQNITIAGPGAAILSISGANSGQVFIVNSGVTASISGLTIDSGSTGGLENQGTLTLSSNIIAGNPGGDINNFSGATLIAGDPNAFTSDTNINNNGTLNMAGNSEFIGTLTGAGVITNDLHLYQIDNGVALTGFNDTLVQNESADNWVANVFTAAAVGTQLQSVSFFDDSSNLDPNDLPNPYITAALYTGSPATGLTLIPGSVNNVALNSGTGWITVPFASIQSLSPGQTFTAALLIDDVPSLGAAIPVFPWVEDTSGSNANSYFDVNYPYDLNGTYVNTYNIAAPNFPTPNGEDWGNMGIGTNADVGVTMLRVNQTAATLTVTGGGTFSGDIQDGNGSNTLALTVAGANQTLVLSGDNTYSGLTTINSGDFLRAGSATALTPSTSVNANGTLDLHDENVAIDALNGGASGALINSGAATSTLTVTGGGDFAGNITGAATAFTIAPSIMILLGNNTYSGLTTINVGDTLQAGSITAFSATSDVADYGTLDLGGYSNSIHALNGNGLVTSSTADATLTVTGGGIFSGTIEDDGAVALTVGGASETLSLTGTNTYTGQTTVNATNTLLVDGSETSAVSVAGTLGGTGGAGAVTVAGGTVNPGDPVNATGTLSAASADFSAGNLTVNITGASPAVTADLLSVAGNVTLGGSSSLTLDLNGLTLVGGGSFTIVSDGSQTGTFGSVSVINNPNGYLPTVSYVGHTVVVTFPPPPSITSVVINEDISALYNAAGQPSPGVQRSMVNDVVYTFSEPVNINPSDMSVFTIAVAAGWTGTVPTLSWSPVTGSGYTQWAVTFSGAGVTGGSIANGAYDITVQDPGSITAMSDSQDLSLAPSGIGGATQAFYRLYGDINGDEFVNASDNLKFKQALTTYNAAFDFNGDDVVNAADNFKFKNDLTVNFSGFTPTI